MTRQSQPPPLNAASPRADAPPPVPRVFDYYRTRKDASEDARELRSRGVKCRVENTYATRARRGTGDTPWKIVVIEETSDDGTTN